MASSPTVPRILLSLAVALSLAAGAKNYLSQGALSKAKAEVQTYKTAAETQAANDKKAIDQAKAEAAEATKAKASLEQRIASNSGDSNKSKQEVDAIRGQLQSKDTELADLKKQLADAKNVVIPAATPDPELLRKVADAEVKVKEQEALVKAAEAKADDAEKRVSSLEADASRRAQNALKPGLEGRILVVNPNWNFVVLNIGDRQGVVSGASMIVKRGGELVGKIKITSVEPSTSIADIQPGSLGPKGGFPIQPGDVVIFPGS
jgi:hypothetical protein